MFNRCAIFVILFGSHASPQSLILEPRWELIGQDAESKLWLDSASVHRKGPVVSLTMKREWPGDVGHPYTIKKGELNCATQAWKDTQQTTFKDGLRGESSSYEIMGWTPLPLGNFIDSFYDIYCSRAAETGQTP